MSFKGFAHLEKIVQTSSEVASLNFSTNDARVTALLEPSSSQKAIRPTPLRGPDPVTVDKILRAANVLAQICNLQDAKEQIEFLAQRHEEITSSIDSLESIMKKQRINLEKCKIAERAIFNMDGEASSSGNQMSKIEEEIWHHEKEILALEMIKKEYIKKVNSLDEELSEQRLLEEEELIINHRLGINPCGIRYLIGIHFINLLQQTHRFPYCDVLFVQDTQLEELESLLKFKSQNISKKADMDEGKGRQSLEFNNHVIKVVNNTLVDYVASTLEESDIDLNVPIPVPSQQAIIAAIILQILRNVGGELFLADLKSRIGQVVREKGWQENEGIKALYLLVANKL
ncbi:14857_t:CDS:2, partial [Gigaspora rosea]